MKNKKLLFYAAIAISVILIIIVFISFVSSKNSNKNINNQIAEYTPAEEFSDEQIRKTIISLYFKNIETNSLIAEAKCIDVKDLSKDPYTYLINLLISGPENEKLESPIPEGTKVNSCTLKRKHFIC